MRLDGIDSRRLELELEVSADVALYPRDVDYDLDSRIIIKDWTRCHDPDIISSIFRYWREEANRLYYALRKDTEIIYKIDIKGDDISDADRHNRSVFLSNIESIIGKGNGEAWLKWDPELRWSKLLDHLQIKNVFPREKVGRVYKTVSCNGNLWLQQKSIDRAFHQMRNQSKKNPEIFSELPILTESQTWAYLGKIAEFKELIKQSMKLVSNQENLAIKRLVGMKKNGNGNDIKKLLSFDESKPFDFIDVDNIVNGDD